MDIHRIVRAVVFIVLVADFRLCLSQQPTRSMILIYDAPLAGLRSREGKISIGPNREDASQMFNMLRSAGVRKELALDESQSKLVCKMFDDEPMIIQQLLRAEKADDAYSIFRQRNINAMEDVIASEQSRRLHQIALRAEITVLGLPVALTEGRFGESIGINENQKSGVIAKGTTIELRRKQGINEVLAKAEDELLLQLQEDQVVAAKRLIGAHFLFDDHYSLKSLVEKTLLVKPLDTRHNRIHFDIPVVGLEKSPLDGKLTIGPNIDKPAELFNFMRSERVRNELAFRDTPLQVLNTMVSEYWAIVREYARRGENSTHAMQVLREENGKTIGAMMTLDQTVRLKQLARRTEVACIGLSRALTEGRLGECVEINDSQRIAVSEKEREMEDRVQKELWEVMASAEIELLEVLTTTQRDTARQALGKYFLYEDALKLKDFVSFKKMQNSDTSR